MSGAALGPGGASLVSAIVAHAVVPQRVLRSLAAALREHVLVPLAHRPGADPVVIEAARETATEIVTAAAPFAASSYARARLLRQLHASGLCADELGRTAELLDLAGTPF